MNAKMISAVLGTLALAAPMMARADDAAAKTDTTTTTKTETKTTKTKKTKTKKADDSTKKAGEKSCSGDKGCGAKK